MACWPLPYFVGFQLFGLIGAQEGQNQVGDWVESTFILLLLSSRKGGKVTKKATKPHHQINQKANQLLDLGFKENWEWYVTS